MSKTPENQRESGARKLSSRPDAADTDRVGMDKAKNRPPKHGEGLSQAVDETNEKTRQSDGTRWPRSE